MKRPLEEQSGHEIDSTKRAKLSCADREIEDLINPQVPETLQLAHSSISFYPINKDLGRYNRLLEFAAQCGPESDAWRQAVKVKRVVQDIDEVMSRALQQAIKKHDLLERRMEQFDSFVMRHDGWYEVGDITMLSEEQLTVCAMDRADRLEDPPQDAERLANSMRSKLPAILRSERPPDEDDGNNNVFWTKIIKIMHLLWHASKKPREGEGTFHAFRFLLTLKGLLRGVERRVPKARAEQLSRDLEHQLRMHAEGEYFYEGNELYAFPSWYNFASCCRELREGMASLKSCKLRRRYDRYDEKKEQCSHEWNLPMLDYLQKRAYGELHATVMLTIGTILPAELAEHVFEHALIAEGVPSEPSVWEMQSFPKKKWNRKHKVHRTKMVQRKVVKPAYQCRRTCPDNEEPDSDWDSTFGCLTGDWIDSDSE